MVYIIPNNSTYSLNKPFVYYHSIKIKITGAAL